MPFAPRRAGFVVLGFVRTPLARATVAGDAYVCVRVGWLVGWVKDGTSI